MRPAVPSPEIVQVAKRLPKNLHMGTSSLSFPGWAGIVYAEQYRVPVLARYGLRAYAQHPLLNALNVDSTFYKPPDVELLTQQAALVPDDFRFVVKAYTGLTDVEIAELTKYFLNKALRQHGRYFEVPPEIVLEIAFDRLQPSARHSSGLAMRFPRIVRIRTDKGVAEIDTLATARALAEKLKRQIAAAQNA